LLRVETAVALIFTVAFAVFLAGAILFLSHIFGPRKRVAEKMTVYESGVEPGADARSRIPLRYYLIAMLFIIFDVEVAFVLPWAVLYRGSLSSIALIVEMAIFVAVLAGGYVYAWRKGALSWE
jgi:NADH-quinone oxidoreductase subunit A